MGAQVIVAEVQPVRALEATMDGYQVMSLKEAAGLGGEVHGQRGQLVGPSETP